jgi:hypothetical protein
VEAIETTAVAPPKVDPQIAHQAEPGVKERESLVKTKTPSSQSGGGAARPALKPRKVISRRKAGKQMRAVVVTTPKEEAEMVDLGARPKKRGRPRKIPKVDPPDPHKGSVLYPKKGVCADPVEEGAILGKGGAEPHGSDKERQLALDIGRGKT